MNISLLREKLLSNIDEKYQKGNQMTVPTNKSLGVRSAILTKIAKDISKSNYHECIALYEKLICSEYLEEQMIGAKLLQFICKQNPEQVFSRVVNHMDDIRDWCVCDTLATQSALCYILKNPDTVLKSSSKYVEDKNFWVRRCGLAMLIPLCLKKNKGPADVAKILSVLDKVMLDEEKYVQKAIHWVLREVTWRDEAKVYSFILKWKGKANRSILWQGSEKLRTEWRDKIK